jgi:hypothetical protein
MPPTKERHLYFLVAPYHGTDRPVKDLLNIVVYGPELSNTDGRGCVAKCQKAFDGVDDIVFVRAEGLFRHNVRAGVLDVY